jgi:hypothetical protein
MNTLHRFAYLFLFVTTVSYTSCSIFGGDDDDGPGQEELVNISLDGEWEVNSFVIANAGETMGLLFDAITLEFDQEESTTGEFTITFDALATQNSPAGRFEYEGEYEIIDAGRIIVLEEEDGLFAEEYDLDLDGDDLELDGGFAIGTTIFVGTMEAERD